MKRYYICFMISCKGSLYKVKNALLFVFVIVYYIPLFAQSNWKEIDILKSFYSGISIACADVNGDVIDDLLILDQSKQLWLGINNGANHFFWSSLGYHQNSRVFSVNVADIDNNGFNDILLSGESIKLTILYQDRYGFHSAIVDANNFYSQAACIYDYNQDGWLDFTLCDDNQVSRTYLNDKSGQLNSDTTLINLSLSDRSKNAGNYGCIWTDFDWDGNPDLYISKCRPGVDDPTDLRRVNQMYVKESGQWIEKATELNLNVGDQSWISLFEDFDNDGLQDVLVVNHYSPSLLFKQNQVRDFEDVTLASGLSYPGIAIQVLCFDVDNDGDIDILFAGTSSQLWLNQGKMKFELSKHNVFEKPFSSCAYGDFNKDGFIDIYVSYADLLNSPSNKKDKLWMNPGNKNHFITLSLSGSQSNKNGIGVKIKLYTNSKLQIRELHGGESYGIQNTLNIHFGLGGESLVDSLVVYWPSGLIDRFTNMPANKHYLLNESKCWIDFSQLQAFETIVECDQVDTVLSADSKHSSIQWNDGSTNTKISVKKEGVYFYTGLDENNCPIISNPISILLNPALNPKLNIQYTYLLCEGETLNLNVESFQQVRWSTGEISPSLLINESGSYFGSVSSICEIEFTDTLQVSVNNLPESPIIQADTLYSYGIAELMANHTNVFWYSTKDDVIPLSSGKIFFTDSLFFSRTYWAEAFETHAYPHIHGGPLSPRYEVGPLHADFLNNKMLFNVYKDLLLDSVTLFTNHPGERQIELYDAKGILLHKVLVNLTAGKSQVFLGFFIKTSPTPYYLTTNESLNIKNLGTKSPKLFRSDKDFFYPFFIEDKLRILSSDKGDSYFYYFYDWVLREADIMCLSQRVEVPVVLNLTKTIEENIPDRPFYFVDERRLRLENFLKEVYSIEIMNIEGKSIKSYADVKQDQDIIIPVLSPGLYILSIRSKEKGWIYNYKWCESH